MLRGFLSRVVFRRTHIAYPLTCQRENEQQIKSCNRLQKRELIDSHNPGWSDLSSEFILGSFYSDLLRSGRGLAATLSSEPTKNAPDLNLGHLSLLISKKSWQ